MKVVVDMNLSPSWVDGLARLGFDAVHWSVVGASTAPDPEILAWARERGFVVVTNDLDFAAILAATRGDAPSVVQVRAHDLLSDAVITLVAATLAEHRQAIEQGALVSVEEEGARVRMLPLRRDLDTP